MGITDFNKNNNNSGISAGSGGSSGATAGPDPMGIASIDEYLVDYNDKFKSKSPIMFRDEIMKQIQAILIGKDKPNAMLVGAAGTGKTKIVEDLARRIANNDPTLPTKLQGCTIYELPLSNIVAGSALVGMIEKKIQAIIKFAEDPSNKAIIFIDEIHQLVESDQTYNKIAQILKPALSRGDIRVIGATTIQEYNNLCDDPAFNRRFSKIIVDELTPEQTVTVLQKVMPEFFSHYSNKIQIDSNLANDVVSIADKYATAGSHRPDNALTLLDRTIADAVVQRKYMEEEAKKTNNQAVLAALKSLPFIQITSKQLKSTAMCLMTGHAKKHEFDKDELLNKLTVIKGQQSIIDSVVTLVNNHNLELFPKTIPTTMLFAGPSGVGKTETTKIIAEYMTDNKPIILNMTEFNSPASINRIIGAPAGYVGYDSNAELPFDILDSNPYQVILLDEFEKCNAAVQRLFMSVFDEGTLKTSKGKTIDFSKSIIIATTNAGHFEKARHIGFTENESKSDFAETVNTLSECFDKALLNRFQGNIFTFNFIGKDTYKEIMQETYKKEVARIKQNRRTNLPDEIPDNDLNELADTTYVDEFGARPAYNAVKNYIYKHV